MLFRDFAGSEDCFFMVGFHLCEVILEHLCLWATWSVCFRTVVSPEGKLEERHSFFDGQCYIPESARVKQTVVDSCTCLVMDTI